MSRLLCGERDYLGSPRLNDLFGVAATKFCPHTKSEQHPSGGFHRAVCKIAMKHPAHIRLFHVGSTSEITLRPILLVQAFDEETGQRKLKLKPDAVRGTVVLRQRSEHLMFFAR